MDGDGRDDRQHDGQQRDDEVVPASHDAVSSAAARLGDRIRRVRQERGMSQRDLARGIVSASYVSLLETGQRSPRTDVVSALAERLGTSVEALVDDPREPQPFLASVETQLELRWAKIALANGDATDAAVTLRRLLDDDRLSDGEVDEVRRNLALAYELDGHLTEAVALLESMSGLDDSLDPEAWTTARAQLCRCYKELGDVDRAIDVGEDVLRRLDGRAPTDARAVLATTLGGAYYERGDLARARQVLTDVLSGSALTAGSHVRGGALWNSSLVAAAENRFEEALMLAERALAIYGEGDNARNLARLKVAYAWLQLETGHEDVDGIRRMLLHARVDLEAEGSVNDRASCSTELARCELLLGRHGAARDAAEHARSLVVGKRTIAASHADAVLGQVLLLSGDVAEGVELMRSAAQDLTELDVRRDAARVWRDLAELQNHHDDHEGAQASMESAMSVLGIEPRTVRTLLRAQPVDSTSTLATS